MTTQPAQPSGVADSAAAPNGARPPLPVAVAIDTRRAALQARVSDYVRQQYRVVSQTDTSAQLVKPKRLSFVWLVVWTLLAVLPGVVYVFYHVFLKRERQVYLTVDEQGRVSETRDKR